MEGWRSRLDFRASGDSQGEISGFSSLSFVRSHLAPFQVHLALLLVPFRLNLQTLHHLAAMLFYGSFILLLAN